MRARNWFSAKNRKERQKVRPIHFIDSQNIEDNLCLQTQEASMGFLADYNKTEPKRKRKKKKTKFLFILE